MKKFQSATSEKQLRRVRRICAALPETTEKLLNGEPTFFVCKKVFAMFANNPAAAGLPAPIGIQEMLIAASPEKFFKSSKVFACKS